MKKLLSLLVLFFAISCVSYGVGVEVALGAARQVMHALLDEMETILFLIILCSVAVWILRLHFSDDPELKKFNLQKLVSQADGTPDGEKIAAWIARLSGTYGFFFVLHHSQSNIVAYAGTFFTVMLGHLVANRMTARPLPQPDGVAKAD